MSIIIKNLYFCRYIHTMNKSDLSYNQTSVCHIFSYQSLIYSHITLLCIQISVCHLFRSRDHIFSYQSHIIRYQSQIFTHQSLTYLWSHYNNVLWACVCVSHVKMPGQTAACHTWSVCQHEAGVSVGSGGVNVFGERETFPWQLLRGSQSIPFIIKD